MKFLWLWLATWLQRRQEKRVLKAERIADDMIIREDRDFARVLGILPPLPVAPYGFGYGFQMLGARGALQSGMQQQNELSFVQMSGSKTLWPANPADLMQHNPFEQTQQMHRDAARMQNIGAMLGSALGPAGNVLGGAVGSLFGQLLGNMKGRHH